MHSNLTQIVQDPQRLAALHELGLLDTPAEQAFDRLAKLAARILHTPIVLISLVGSDRQFFKSCLGLPEPWSSWRETPLSHSFCQHVVASGQPLVIPDARRDPQLLDNLAIRDLNVIAYLGSPLILPGGQVIGSFCVIDSKPRDWTDEQISIVRDLAASVMTEINLRHMHDSLQEQTQAQTMAMTAALRESEALYRDLVESSLDMICTHDLEGRLLSVNQRAGELLGYRVEELVGMNLRDLVVPRFRAQFDDYLAEIRRARVLRGYLQMQTRDGKRRVWYYQNTLRTEGVSVPIVRGTAHDVTEQFETGRKLRESESLYRELIELAADGIFISDAEGRFTEVNAAGCALAGYTREELLHLGIVDMIPPQDRQTNPPRLDELWAGKTIIRERRLQRKDGTIVLVESSVKQLPGGRLQGIVRDVSERKQAEALREGNSRALEQLLRGTSLSEVLDTLVRTVEAQIEGAIGSVLLLDPDGRHLRHGAGPHLPEAYNQAIDGVEIGPAVGSCGTAAYESRQMIVENIQTDPLWADYRKLAAAHDLQACWSQPIFAADGQVLGTFAMYYREPRSPSERDLRLIEDAGHLAAVAIENSRVQQALVQSDKRFRATFEQAAVGVAHVSTEGRWLRVNQKLCDIVGYTRQELLTKTFQDITHPDDLDADLAQVTRMLAGEIPTYTMEKRYFHKNGKIVWINLTVSLTRKSNGEPDYFISVVEDIAQRRQADATRRATLEAALDCIIEMDHEGKITAISAVAEKTFGYAPAEVIGRELAEVLVPDAQRAHHRQGLINYLTTGRHAILNRHVEMDALRADGTTVPVELMVRVIENSDPPRFIGFARDITARKQAEAVREKLLADLTQRNVEMENFVYTISHDLKAPLITIGGFASLLVKDIERNDKERGRESVQEIRKAAEGMQQLIDDLLLLSRTGQVQGEPEDVDLHAILGDVQARCASHIERERATIRVVSPLPRLHVDRLRFGQVLQNLLDNGVKFHRKGVDPVLEIGAERTNGEARLYVRDNGIGIEKRYQEKIFGLFERLDTGREGTGVGLTIARRIVEQHGGRLWVESEPGRGSTFWLSIPDSVIVDDSAGEAARHMRTLR